MGAYRSLGQMLDQYALGHSKHRKARVHRFIFRHRKKHRRIIKALLERQRYHEQVEDERFLELQRAQGPGDIHPRHQRPTGKKRRPW